MSVLWMRRRASAVQCSAAEIGRQYSLLPTASSLRQLSLQKQKGLLVLSQVFCHHHSPHWRGGLFTSMSLALPSAWSFSALDSHLVPLSQASRRGERGEPRTSCQSSSFIKKKVLLIDSWRRKNSNIQYILSVNELGFRHYFQGISNRKSGIPFSALSHLCVSVIFFFFVTLND